MRFRRKPSYSLPSGSRMDRLLFVSLVPGQRRHHWPEAAACVVVAGLGFGVLAMFLL
jgi:hypothetical protein